MTKITACAQAARLWSEREFPARAHLLQRIQDRTGYGVSAVEFALDALFGSITEEALRETIENEIGDRVVRPIGRVAVISSRTTIGVAVVPAVFAICAGCDVLVKDREDYLVRAFFETLAAQETLNQSFEAGTWEGPERDLSGFDAVVAFGTDETLEAIRAQLSPSARFIPYGPACSVGYVAREALVDSVAAARIAQGAARDLVLYESEGCLSLHALFVEEGGNVAPETFARILASAVEQANAEFPVGAARNDVAKRVTARDLALFRGSLLAADAKARYAIERGSPEHAPAFLPRVLALHTAREPREMLAYARRHALPLESCAVAGTRDDIVACATDAGAHRIAEFGAMQVPPLGYEHGGRPRIAEFVQFVSQVGA
jgi:hypothetical protein